MALPEPVIAFIGGGPRTAGILERLAHNRAGVFDGRFSVCVIEPWEPGSGRIWRYDQHPLLRLNSMAGDVTMFTDESVACDGPAADGPSLVEWAAGVATGRIGDARIRSGHIWEQLRGVRPSSFPSRQLQSHYLEWFFRHSVRLLNQSGVRVELRRDTVVAVDAVRDPRPDAGRPSRASAVPLHPVSGPDAGRHLLRLASGGMVAADVLVYSLGHTDTEPSPQSAAFTEFADLHGCFYSGPAYTTDVDYSRVQPGSDVIVSGLGLAFVDLTVLLMEGRGGTFQENAEGVLEYRPSGLEPRLWAGSRRGVPYHSKITSTLKAPAESRLRFFTAEAVADLRRCHGELDFRSQIWPLLAKEAGYGYYRELFLGYPERTTRVWSDFLTDYAALDWYSQERVDLVAAAVPDPSLRLDLETLDRPLRELRFSGLDQVQETVTAYLEADLSLRTSPDHSETLGLFMALLRVYMEAGRILPPEFLTAASRLAITGWWHGFFSFVDSGPPPERLRELLALHRAGLVRFLGPQLQVRTDDAAGLFTAVSAVCGESVSAAALIEARLPETSAARSANPALRGLLSTGTGSEEALGAPNGVHLTGKLKVDGRRRVVDASGRAREGIYAIGAGTSSWGAGAFSRPRSNAAAFRENDALARELLAAAAGVPAASTTAAVTGDAQAGTLERIH